MSYRTKWYNRQECASVAREISSASIKVFGIELEDVCGNGVHMNGGYGGNIERKAIRMGFDQTAIRAALGADADGHWLDTQEDE